MLSVISECQSERRCSNMVSEDGQKWRQYFAAGAANLGILSAGICMGWTSPTLPMLQDIDASPLDDVITDDEASWVSSLVPLGAAVSPFYTAISTDLFGRKPVLLSSGVPLMVGWVLVATAKQVGQLYAARFIWGLAVGQLFTSVPMYVAEIAEPEVRGALGSFLQISLVLGFLLVYSIGPFVSYLVLSIMAMVPTLMFLVLFFFMPESPRYLLKKDRQEDAIQSLMSLRGKSYDGVQEELIELQTAQDKSPPKGSFKDLWTRGNIKSFYIVFGILAIQQLVGINYVQFNMETIFSETGSEMDPAISAIIIGIVQVLASCVTPFVVDRFGRKILLIGSTTGLTIALGLLGLFFILDNYNNPAVQYLSWLPVTALVLYTTVFCIGIGPLCWIVVGEVLSPEIKFIGSSVGTGFSWFLGFLITKYFSAIADSIGMHYAFWIFGLFAFLGIFFVQFCIPETKGMTLAQIQDLQNNQEIHPDEERRRY